MADPATRMITDIGDTLFITRWDDESIDVAVIDRETKQSMQVTLSQRDIAEIADVIHGHGDETGSER